MRSFISHFSAWIAALAVIAMLELAYYYVVHPSWAQRSNFMAFGLEDHFVADQMDRILYEKLDMSTAPQPDFVQVGDSSGFFGIMPDIVEQYLPGMKYLNASCCATQGFHGYLALLRYNLRRFPSIKYMVVHSGILGAFPGPLQWRHAPRTLNTGVPMKTLGDKMERSLNPPESLLDLPTNSLRQTVLQRTFLADDVARSVNILNGKFEIIVDGLRVRQGWGLEVDAQAGVGELGVDTPKCYLGPKYETFFDWKSLSRRSYLDAFIEEYVALADEFNVVPILFFQITPCIDPGFPDVAAMRAALKRLQQRFPRLKVPVDIIDTYPENNFSVPLHVQRDLVQETSRRLGRALHDIVFPDAPLAVRPPPADSLLAIHKVTRASSCGDRRELTDSFAEECNGRSSCELDLGQWRDISALPSCTPFYVAEFQCGDGPVRIVRQETERRFGGRFRLDCRTQDRWPRDSIPHGMLVADASIAGQGGSPIGLTTLRVKAFCDGLASCDYPVQTPDRSVPAGAFTARWYCGGEERSITLPHVKPEDRVHLACR